jgi:hypothetical protein
MPKFLFVTGGVVSSVGKGITVASLGRLFKSRGLSVAIMKLDPYINVDPGTMSPYQHGEVFVTDDGAETDLDLGHYERFTDEPASQASNVFKSVAPMARFRYADRIARLTSTYASWSAGRSTPISVVTRSCHHCPRQRPRAKAHLCHMRANQGNAAATIGQRAGIARESRSPRHQTPPDRYVRPHGNTGRRHRMVRVYIRLL